MPFLPEDNGPNEKCPKCPHPPHMHQSPGEYCPVEDCGCMGVEVGQPNVIHTTDMVTDKAVEKHQQAPQDPSPDCPPDHMPDQDMEAIDGNPEPVEPFEIPHGSPTEQAIPVEEVNGMYAKNPDPTLPGNSVQPEGEEDRDEDASNLNEEGGHKDPIHPDRVYGEITPDNTSGIKSDPDPEDKPDQVPGDTDADRGYEEHTD